MPRGIPNNKSAALPPAVSTDQANPEIEALRAQLAKAEAEKAEAQAIAQTASEQLAEVQTETDRAWEIAKQYQDHATTLEATIEKQSAAATMALNNPVMRETRHEIPESFDMGNAYFGDDQPIDLMIPQYVPDTEAAKKYQDELNFMAQPVVIAFQTTTERNAMQLFPIGHNGRRYLFERGKRYRIPRYIVSELIETMPETFGCVEYVDPADGVKKIKYPGQAGLRFPFSVMQDTQEGLRWFGRKGTGYSREVHL